ncbi:hypothetical protein GVAV_001312 [Gurleya vavrai]
MFFDYQLLDKKIIKRELEIKKQIQKYALNPKIKQVVKRYSDKYLKSKLSNKQKFEKSVEFDILPRELQLEFNHVKKECNNDFIIESSNIDDEEIEDESLADDDNDYNADYEADEEFVDEEDVQDDDFDN